MDRAIQTAEIIAEHFPGKEITKLEYLEEKLPCEATIRPGLPYKEVAEKKDDIVKGFNKIFVDKAEEEEVTEVYVIHANLIRYYFLK
ncbi:MAG: Serine/threonine-protein phosphatase pgam5, mitochondrial [Paramarteilia canceri]